MSITADTPVRAQASRTAGILPLTASLVLSAPILAVAAWGDDTEDNPLRRFFVTIGIATACGIVVFLWAVPRASHSRRIAPALALLAILTLPAFWLGMTGAFAVGAITAARRRPERTRTATVAAVAGVVALAASAVLAWISSS